MGKKSLVMLGFLLDVVVEKEGAAAFGSLSHYSSFLGLKPFIMKSFSVANFLSKCFHIKLTNKILNTKSLVSSLLFSYSGTHLTFKATLPK